MRGLVVGPALPTYCVVIFGSCEWSCYSTAMGGVSCTLCVCMLERTGSRVKDWPSSGACCCWHVRRNTCDFSFKSIGASVEPTSERRQSCLHCLAHAVQMKHVSLWREFYLQLKTKYYQLSNLWIQNRDIGCFKPSLAQILDAILVLKLI